jgi:hypothetical protein
MLAINASCPVQTPAWGEFLVEAITEHIVNQSEPEGYLNAEKAKWLIDRISQDGRVERKTELDLLVAVLAKARWVPASLVGFALAQVREAVICGNGPLRAGEAPVRGAITDREVELVRGMLCALGGDGRIAVTRTEAEILFDINDEIASECAPLAWTELFVKAIANVVMAASGYAVPTRQAALRAHGRVAGRYDVTLAGLNAWVASSLDSVRDAYGEQSAEERSLSRLERQRIEIVTNEEMAGGDARWLAVRLLGDNALSPAEDALVAYLRRKRLIGDPLLSFVRARDGKAA